MNIGIQRYVILKYSIDQIKFISYLYYIPKMFFQGLVRQKRESSNLFSGASRNGTRGDDNLMSKLLREKGSLNTSLQSINEVINQAFDTKNSLLSQRNILQGSASGLTGLVGKFF